ncbi:MAG TPA: MarR family transcriptional regulator [Acidimicrobiales bacterium]|nr:MarR family transcriptional regulator [Acidimicrobiales bacterium]
MAGSRSGKGAAARSPRITYMVKQLELAIRADVDAMAREHGLTAPQYTALTVLHRHPDMSGAQLARRSFVSAQAGNEMISNLERKGLISRQPDPANRRILRIRLTADGERVVKACQGEMDAIERRMLAGIPSGAAADFKAVLSACVQNLQSSLRS